jgi:uncharacterized protein (TIGR04255 family)
MRRKNLPNKVSPNPLLNSIVEIRFESNLQSDQLLNFYLNHFREDFPEILDHKLEPSGKPHRAKYHFFNEKFSILLGCDVIAFENRGDYMFWANYFPLIKDNLLKLNKACEISKIDRVGIRYISFFENEVVSQDSLLVDNSFSFDGYERPDHFFRAAYSKEGVTILVQIPRNVVVEENERKRTGILIDIDVSKEQNIPQQIGQEFFDLIDFLHVEEKAMFFSLLSDTFLETLKPEYDDKS